MKIQIERSIMGILCKKSEDVRNYMQPQKQ